MCGRSCAPLAPLFSGTLLDGRATSWRERLGCDPLKTQPRRLRHQPRDSLVLSPTAICRILDSMADLLVKLYDLPWEKCATPEDVEVRRAFAAEKRLVAQWVAGNFGERWASECEISFM